MEWKVSSIFRMLLEYYKPNERQKLYNQVSRISRFWENGYEQT